MESKCSNCALLVNEKILAINKMGVKQQVPGCLRNIDISTGEKTNCDQFVDSTAVNASKSQMFAFVHVYSYPQTIKNFINSMKEDELEKFLSNFMRVDRFGPVN